MSLQQLTVPLLEWYRSNARDLPWRNTDDPYRIWVSEIMLQQTRVAAVLGYYERFLKEFPTVFDLAEADEQRLLKVWEGLGYYSRVRNMQKAAKQVVEHYSGEIPKTYHELISLCGIGEYTAGAIASAAFGVRVPAVDGNVLRVISRITEDESDISDSKVKKEYRQKLEEILPYTPEEMRVFNQAMMELGATICVPNGAPKCENCPAASFCKAYLHQTWERYPIKSAKKARRVEEKTVFLLVRDGEIALHKRPAEGLLAGLWEFPNVEGILKEQEAYDLLKRQNLRITEWRKQLYAKHIFTHIEWHMTGYVVSVFGEGSDELLWVNRELFSQLALPSAFAKYTQEAKRILE